MLIRRWQPADELGDHPELDQVVRRHLGEQFAHALLVVDTHAAEAEATLADALRDRLGEADLMPLALNRPSL